MSSRRSSALARVPSMGSSFASCFGASAPMSPRRIGGYGLLGGQACVNYKRLGFDDLEEHEDSSIYEKPAQEENIEAEERRKDAEQKTEGPFLQYVAQQLSLEEGGMLDDLKAEELYARSTEKENAVNFGKPWSEREKAGMHTHHTSEVEEPYASEQEGEECGRERKATRKLTKQWSLRERDIIYEAQTPERQEARNYGIRGEEKEEAVGYGRGRKGLWRKFGKPWTTKEKARKEVQSPSLEDEIDRERIGDMQHPRMTKKEDGMTPRRESLCRKVKEACVQALENARRSSPHLSELFLGNQLLMQVTSSPFTARRAARNVPPSIGFLNAVEPMSPPRSSASSTL